MLCRVMLHKCPFLMFFAFLDVVYALVYCSLRYMEILEKIKISTTYTCGSWVRYPVWQHTFVSPSAFSRRAVVSYWRKYVHEVLVNRLGGLSLPRKSVVRLTDRPDMTLDVYHGRKTTIQYNTTYTCGKF